MVPPKAGQFRSEVENCRRRNSLPPRMGRGYGAPGGMSHPPGACTHWHGLKATMELVGLYLDCE